jgi:hypothetical protein
VLTKLSPRLQVLARGMMIREKIGRRDKGI